MDSLHRFVFEQLPVRGEIVHLRGVWREALRRRRYPTAIGEILGQAMAASALLSATVKGEGQLTLQLQSEGPLHLLVSQCTGQRGLRGLARWQAEVQHGGLEALCNPGTLAITLDPEGSRERYQGVVDLTGGSLSSALERYFVQSEQLPTLLALMADQQQAVGWLIQRLPGETRHDGRFQAEWERIWHLAATVGAREIAERAPAELLSKVFATDPIRLFPPEPLQFHCSCHRERIAAVLVSMGDREVAEILAEQGLVKVACEFCGQDYHFDRVDCAGLFSATQAPPSSRHH